MIARTPDRHPQSGAGDVMVLCTYCGSLSVSTSKCSNCGGYFDLLSRQRTQNGMGPWFIRDQVNPFHPGCSYETLRRLIARGRVRPDTVMRGPTTRQFWSFARNTPGVAHLLGACHACHTPVDATAHSCPSCAASFVVADDRQQLGLAPMQLLPGDADPAAVADAAFGPAAPPQEPAGPIGGVSVGSAPTESVEARPVVTRPVRKRSAGPMVAVIASVACAVVALAAVVYMNRADGNAVAVAAEPSGAPVPNEQTRRASVDRGADRGASGASAGIGRNDHSPGRVEPVGVVEDSSQLDIPVDPRTNGASPEADPPLSEPIEDSAPATAEAPAAGVRETASIASMSRQELDAARSEWAQLGRDELVRLADRRLRQLELRDLFGRD
ncbi:MAG: hypothetical protein AAFN41_00400 [Planctomycetota bacterium]